MIQPELDLYAATHPVSARNALRQITAAGRFFFPQEAPGKISLFVSEKDRLVNCNCTKAIAKKWNLPLDIHPTAGHDLALDDPQWLAERIAAKAN